MWTQHTTVLNIPASLQQPKPCVQVTKPWHTGGLLGAGGRPLAGLLPGSSGRRRAEIGALTARKHQPPPCTHAHAQRQG